MKLTPLSFFVCVLLAFAFTTAGMKAQSSSNLRQQDSASQGRTMTQTNGEEVFKANCGRCHMPPMTLSPRITGTVVMHMRVRARLSRQDEKLLLKYLAP
jgi:cytochrome c5